MENAHWQGFNHRLPTSTIMTIDDSSIVEPKKGTTRNEFTCPAQPIRVHGHIPPLSHRSPAAQPTNTENKFVSKNNCEHESDDATPTCFPIPRSVHTFVLDSTSLSDQKDHSRLLFFFSRSLTNRHVPSRSSYAHLLRDEHRQMSCQERHSFSGFKRRSFSMPRFGATTAPAPSNGSHNRRSFLFRRGVHNRSMGVHINRRSFSFRNRSMSGR